MIEIDITYTHMIHMLNNNNKTHMLNMIKIDIVYYHIIPMPGNIHIKLYSIYTHTPWYL